MRMSVDLGNRSYPIVLEDKMGGLGRAIGSCLGSVSRVVCVTNDVVDPLVMPSVEASLSAQGIVVDKVVIPDGESQKTIDGWQTLVLQLLEMGVDRSTPVIAVGGGVIGDLAGFAAASVMRGLPLVQVPTSLLAMVDSSVGGKTAVNTSHGKNLVGAFYQPRLVYGAMSSLDTLDHTHFLSGLGEVIKHAVIADADFFGECSERAERILNRDTHTMRGVVEQCCRIKSEVVCLDENEQGQRAVLNLGHTVGHAIEQVLRVAGNDLPHGVCVAIGLLAEARWAESSGFAEPGTADQIGSLMSRLGLPSEPPPLNWNAVIDAVRFDKKAARGKLLVPVVETIGRVRLDTIEYQDIAELFYSFPGFKTCETL
jgi:3-dehydroquinate synthase